jgi:hypothetical protein
MDPQAYPTEFYIVRAEFQWTDTDFTPVRLQGYCPQVVQPAVPAGGSPSTTQ